MACAVSSCGVTSAPVISIEGQARAISANLLQVGGATVRLDGVRVGDVVANTVDEDAIRNIQTLLGSADVFCTTSPDNLDGNLTGQCFVAGVDVGEWVVSAGLGRAESGLTSPYAVDEVRARAAGRGIWR